MDEIEISFFLVFSDAAFVWRNFSRSMYDEMETPRSVVTAKTHHIRASWHRDVVYACGFEGGWRFTFSAQNLTFWKG